MFTHLQEGCRFFGVQKKVLKKSFPAVLNNLCPCNNHRSRDTDERNWRRPFMYFAVLGVVNATENEQKTPKGDSHICRPSEEDTPPYRFNVRTSNGRFAKSKEKDLRADLHYKKLKKASKVGQPKENSSLKTHRMKTSHRLNA